MPDFGTLDGGQHHEEGGAVISTTLPTSVTANNTAHVKGSWIQLIAATGFPAAGILVTVHAQDTSQSYLVDIGVGAGGSEQVVVPNVPFENAVTVTPMNPMYIPISIPAGSRVAARCQCTGGGGNRVYVQITLVGGGLATPVFGVAATYGAITATSLPTALDAGATANTKGAWVELAASLTAPIQVACVLLSHRAAPGTGVRFFVDVGAGAGGSEQVLMPNIFSLPMYPGTGHWPTVVAVPLSVPAGARLAARASASVNTAVDRVINIAVVGVS